jgi:hypothetical protein
MLVLGSVLTVEIAWEWWEHRRLSFEVTKKLEKKDSETSSSSGTSTSGSSGKHAMGSSSPEPGPWKPKPQSKNTMRKISLGSGATVPGDNSTSTAALGDAYESHFVFPGSV